MPFAASTSENALRVGVPRILRRHSRLRRGFTLLELLVALGIAGMLLTMGVPAWGKWIAERELRDRAEALLDTLDRARSEAIKRGVRVDVCPLAGTDCAGGAAPWENGWMMFADANRSGDRDTAESLIARTR
jgi:type IV fimbrial biogenesis protein FimT